jgi:hypothetical protein
MNDAAYKSWVAQLMFLTPVQIEDVLNRVKVLNIAPLKQPGKSEFGARVIAAICDVLKRNNVEIPSISMLRRSSAYAGSKEKFNDLSSFLEKISRSKIIQDSVLRTAIELLYIDLLQWQGVAISSHTVLQQIHRLPATLHKHFPGYGPELLVKIIKVV